MEDVAKLEGKEEDPGILVLVGVVEGWAGQTGLKGGMGRGLTKRWRQ